MEQKFKRNAKVQEAMEALLNACNAMGDQKVAETMHAVLANDHRTIQQSFFRQFVKMATLYADDPFDGRNEESVKFANKIKEMEQYFPFV